MLSSVRTHRSRNVLGTCLVLILCVGCGSSGTLSGTVSYKGKTLKGGYITFVGKEDGLTFPSSISADGTYTIPQLPTGVYKVCVDTEFLKGDEGANSGAPISRSGKMPPSMKKTEDPKDKDKGYKSDQVDAASQNGYNPGPTNMAAAKKANMEKYLQIPVGYRKPDTTKLEYTVTGGKVVYNVVLD